MTDPLASQVPPEAEARRYRDALGAFATGVTVVTTRTSEGKDVGLTANSFNSVSLDPPMVLWSLARKARSLPAFLGNPLFAVHVLAEDQEDLSQRFAQQGGDKFAGLEVARSEAGIPLLANCSARFECRTAFTHDGGDHVIFVGAVTGFESFGRPPLLFHGGRYAMAVEKKRLMSAPVSDDSEPDSSFSRDFLIYLLGRAHSQLLLGLRRDLEKHGLTEEEWFVLSVLGVSSHRTLEELDRTLGFTGKRVTYDLAARLAAAGFVQLDGGYDPNVKLALTEHGRTVVIELVAAAKGVEAHAERNLGYVESQLLKNALRKIIRDAPLTERRRHPRKRGTPIET